MSYSFFENPDMILDEAFMDLITVLHFQLAKLMQWAGAVLRIILLIYRPDWQIEGASANLLREF